MECLVFTIFQQCACLILTTGDYT